MQDSHEDYVRRFASYDARALEEVLRSLDRDKYPERHALAEAELARKRANPGPDSAPAEGVDAAPARPPVSGIGGWLLLPLIGLFIAPCVWGFVLVQYVALALNPQVGAVFGNPDSPHYFPGWSFFIASVTTASLVLVVFTVWLLVDFFRKKRRVPKLMILLLCAGVVLSFGFHLFMLQAPPVLASSTSSWGAKGIVQSLLAAAIWIPYFLKSERVANTFVN
jgi:hypothetical protein